MMYLSIWICIHICAETILVLTAMIASVHMRVVSRAASAAFASLTPALPATSTSARSTWPVAVSSTYIVIYNYLSTFV